MPPYHTVSGNNITVYLNLAGDTDGTLGNPTDNILAQIAAVWGTIAANNGVTLTIALGASTQVPMNAIPPGLNVITGAVPPANISPFTILVGRGANADPVSRGSRTSYVSYQGGTGYIYEMLTQPAPFVPAISHELAHILGLSDRYYEAVYWLFNWAINRTCRQIRQDDYLMGLNDTRDGVSDLPNVPAFHNSPRLAVRVSLPMATIAVNEPLYVPMNNLMSTGTSTLTPTQIGVILAQNVEQTYRTTNWVAILGDWTRYNTPPTNAPNGASGNGQDFPTNDGNFNDLSKWVYPAWEAGPQEGGQGLLFLPPISTTPYRYGCMTAFRRGKYNGDVIQRTRLAVAMGKTRVYAFGGTTYNVIGTNVVHPNWMCHMRPMIRDLT